MKGSKLNPKSGLSHPIASASQPTETPSGHLGDPRTLSTPSSRGASAGRRRSQLPIGGCSRPPSSLALIAGFPPLLFQNSLSTRSHSGSKFQRLCNKNLWSRHTPNSFQTPPSHTRELEVALPHLFCEAAGAVPSLKGLHFASSAPRASHTALPQPHLPASRL